MNFFFGEACCSREAKGIFTFGCGASNGASVYYDACPNPDRAPWR